MRHSWNFRNPTWVGRWYSKFLGLNSVHIRVYFLWPVITPPFNLQMHSNWSLRRASICSIKYLLTWLFPLLSRALSPHHSLSILYGWSKLKYSAYKSYILVVNQTTNLHNSTNFSPNGPKLIIYTCLNVFCKIPLNVIFSLHIHCSTVANVRELYRKLQTGLIYYVIKKFIRNLI